MISRLFKRLRLFVYILMSGIQFRRQYGGWGWGLGGRKGARVASRGEKLRRTGEVNYPWRREPGGGGGSKFVRSRN